VTPGQLADAVRSVIADAVAAGQLPGPVPDVVRVQQPVRAELGDWSTAVALELVPGPSALRVANLLARRLAAVPGIQRAEVAAPGFVNITLDHPAPDAAGLAELARSIVEAAAHAGGPGPGPASAHPAAGSGSTFAGSGSPAAGSGSPAAERVQFAHGRACAVIRQAGSHGVTRSAFVPGALSHQADHALLTALAGCQAQCLARGQAQYSDPAQQPGAPDLTSLLGHLDLLAGAFGSWYAATRLTPRGHDPVTDHHRTRLWLAEATRIVLACGLKQLGLSAPERI
jgi:arginyl-tRNA synthetase